MATKKPDPFNKLFENYARHYESIEERGRGKRLPPGIKRLKRDRLPRWIDDVFKDARILDAGCAQGHLLEALRLVGFVNLTGIELSTQLLAFARKRLPESVHLIQADLREWIVQAPAECFDVVFFYDVLEHLPREDTVEVLRQFHRILAREGRFNVRVPNMSCLLATSNMAIDFTHVTHFTEFSLLQVLESAGFDPSKITLERHPPRLFWSWHYPHRAFFRLLNYLRWYVNNGFHRSLYLLVDLNTPSVFDPNLLVLVRK